MFQKPTKLQKKLRLALCGPSGSGKTYSSLAIATGLGGSIAVIDTERNSSSLYIDDFNFVSASLTNHHPSKYIEVIKAASEYDVLVIDSLTHAWFSELEIAGGRFDGWAKARPLERALIDAILDFPGHVIATMRSKTEYVVEQKENRQGKMSASPTKVGTAPIQSAGIEYEFDVTGDMSLDHILAISKTRCKALDQTKWLNPGQDLADVLKTWLTDGAVMPESGQQKVDRFKAACQRLGIDPKQTKELFTQRGFNSARDMSSKELDELITSLPNTNLSNEEF